MQGDAGAVNSIKVFICRFFQEDEEMLILTRGDELSRTYDEDCRLQFEDRRLQFDHITNRNTLCDDTGGNESSFRRTSLSLTEKDNPALKENLAPTTMKDTLAFEETRTTVISTGPRTITATLAVSTAESFCIKHNKPYDDTKTSCEIEADKTGVRKEENPSFSQKQGDKRCAGLLQVNAQKQTPPKNVEKEKEGEETEDGTKQLGASIEGESTKMNLTNPVQSPSGGAGNLKTSPTITAWEAGWNVTNAIQVDTSVSPEHVKQLSEFKLLTHIIHFTVNYTKLYYTL